MIADENSIPESNFKSFNPIDDWFSIRGVDSGDDEEHVYYSLSRLIGMVTHIDRINDTTAFTGVNCYSEWIDVVDEGEHFIGYVHEKDIPRLLNNLCERHPGKTVIIYMGFGSQVEIGIVIKRKPVWKRIIDYFRR